MKTLRHMVAGLALIALAGCGYTTEDRALSGAALGAGIGAGAGALTGGSLVTGALLGGLAGGAGGALTKPSQVDLGRPIWNR